MRSEQLYLKQNIQVEPLVHNWYAWIHLLSPATSALNMVNRYLNIMRSYVNSPIMHKMAIADPAMRGGPFIDLDGEHVEQVWALIEETEKKCENQIAFVQAVRDLNTLLRTKAKGYCLEPLYKEVPEILRGYVELYYDLNNNPAFRFFEALLYHSPFYSVESQTLALSEIVRDGDRPFILSTPKIIDEKSLQLRMPFNSPELDELFKMKKTPQTFDFICRRLSIPIEHQRQFRSFFTTEAPPPYEGYEGEKMRIRYFGHACILIESKGVSILLDPVLSYTYDSEISRYTYQDLPDTIDYVLITHSHQDHILLETMLQIRHKVKNIIIARNIEGALQDPSLRLALINLGFDMVREISEFEEITIPNGSITGIPFLGEHHDLHIHSKMAYCIRIADRSLLAVADSCNIEPVLYRHVCDQIGHVDVLFLGMECDGAPVSWAYGPLFDELPERSIDQSRRGRGCNYEEGISIVNQFHCKEVYVYAMGQEPWLRHILDLEHDENSNPTIQSQRLLNDCRDRGIVAEYLFGEKEILNSIKDVSNVIV